MSVKFLETIMKTKVGSGGFDKALRAMRFISGGGGNCTAEIKIEKEHLNAGGNLHGGFTALVADAVSTYGLMTAESQAPGVSVNLNVSYMKPAREGDVILVESVAKKIGKQLAFCDINIKLKDSDKLIATASHTKYIGSKL